MDKAGYVWVILPYALVFSGLVVYHSAWGALIGFHVGLLPLILSRKQTLKDLFRIPTSKRLFLFVPLCGILAGLGLSLLWPYIGLQAGFSRRMAEIGITGWIWMPFILYFTLVNPWLEEVYWRNILGSSSRRLAPVDFLFAGYHMIILSVFVDWRMMALAFVILILASWFWRQVSRYTGSLLPAVFSHMLADLSLLVVLYGFAG